MVAAIVVAAAAVVVAPPVVIGPPVVIAPLPPVAPAPPIVHIPLPTARAQLLKQQMTDVATVIIKRQIVASDAVPLPQTALAGGFDALRTTIVAALDPALTTPRLANHRITGLSTAQAAGLSDIMAAPDLSEPTYQALAAISHDWLLPGIDTLPAGTTTLVESNRSFISAFLVGMNHELARELLWLEYPTDQRGTYSRQFWSRRDTGSAADPYDLVQTARRGGRAHARAARRTRRAPPPRRSSSSSRARSYSATRGCS